MRESIFIGSCDGNIGLSACSAPRAPTARALNPEQLLATPSVKPDEAEYLGRIGEVNRMILTGNSKLEKQQRQAEA